MTEPVLEICCDWTQTGEPGGRAPQAAVLLEELAIGWGARIDEDDRPWVYRLDGDPIPGSVIEALQNG